MFCIPEILYFLCAGLNLIRCRKRHRWSHFSCAKCPSNELPTNDNFPDEQLLAIFKEPWFADIVNYLVTN